MATCRRSRRPWYLPARGGEAHAMTIDGGRVARGVGPLELFTAAALAVAVSGCCYWAYFQIAPWVQAQNLVPEPGTIVPWVVPFTAERDGLEVYVLYGLTLATVLLTVLSTAWLLGGRWHVRPRARPAPLWLRLALLPAALGLGGWFLLAVGFHPPLSPLLMEEAQPLRITLTGFVLVAVAVFTAAALQLELRAPRRLVLLTGLALFPLCFAAVNIDPTLSLDYNYLFSPALRLLQGAPPREIYFQYDLLPSLLAAGWLYLGLELNSIRLLGQLAYYAAILGVFLLARRLFLDRRLAVLLLATLVVGRLYTSDRDVMCCFQVTPLRLDLWLPLVAAVWWRGAWHWLPALVCGVLLVLAHKFGIIYSLAYLQLLIVLAALAVLEQPQTSGRAIHLWSLGRRAALPLGILLLSGIASVALLHNQQFGNYAAWYQKIGIGFLPISPHSFFWYLLPALALGALLLLRLRHRLMPRYFEPALLTMLCAAGSLIYFFGRSHEHALINIAIILLFVLFITVDLAGRLLLEGDPPGWVAALARPAPPLVGAVVLALIVVFYAENIAAKFSRQVAGLWQARATYPVWVDRAGLTQELAAIRTATGGSDKLYFMSRWDFQYYYFGGYRLHGYVNPFWAWITAEPLREQLEQLLDDRYFLVISEEMSTVPAALGVQYDRSQVVGELIVVSRSPDAGRADNNN